MASRGVRVATVARAGGRRARSLSPARGILVAAAVGLLLWLLVLLVVHSIG
jgi:hypothetical protein